MHYGRTTNDHTHSTTRQVHEYRITTHKWLKFLDLTTSTQGHSVDISFSATMGCLPVGIGVRPTAAVQMAEGPSSLANLPQGHSSPDNWGKGEPASALTERNRPYQEVPKETPRIPAVPKRAAQMTRRPTNTLPKDGRGSNPSHTRENMSKIVSPRGTEQPRTSLRMGIDIPNINKLGYLQPLGPMTEDVMHCTQVAVWQGQPFAASIRLVQCTEEEEDPVQLPWKGKKRKAR